MGYQNISDKTAKSYLKHGLQRTDLRFLDQLLSDLNGQSGFVVKAMNQAGKEDLLVPAIEVLKKWDRCDRVISIKEVCQEIENCELDLSVFTRDKF